MSIGWEATSRPVPCSRLLMQLSGTYLTAEYIMMQNSTGIEIFWLQIVAGVTGAFFTILSIVLEKNLAYFVRRMFLPPERVGKRPAKKPSLLWMTWGILCVTSIVSLAISGFIQSDKPAEVAIYNQLTPTEISPNPKTVNLAPNPSFEQGALQPAGWSSINSQNAEYKWNPALAHTGNRSLCIDRVEENVSAEWDTSIWIPVDAGRSYHFSVWARGDVNREVYIGISPLDAKGNWLTGYAMLLSINPTTWTKTEGDYAIPYMGSFVVLTLEVNNPDGFTNDVVCFDDITFEPIDSSP